MTDDTLDLDAIELRLSEASKPPWLVGNSAEIYRVNESGTAITLAETRHYDNALFMAHARSDIPALVAEVRRLKTDAEAGAKEYHRLFDQATTEIAQLRDAGSRMGRILYKLLHGIIESSPEAKDMTDEGREANAACKAWDAVVLSSTPSVAPCGAFPKVDL